MRPLDPRLCVAAAAVRRGSVVADVGTDHGYLACELVGSGKCPRGYASDIHPMPLEVARRHIREIGLSGKIQVVLSDGLQGLPGAELDDIVLAGMGGELIGKILTGVPWTQDTEKRFILQPMTRAEHLRCLLYQKGFVLTKESAVRSGRFLYTVMTAKYTGETQNVDELFAQTGLLLKERSEQARAYLEGVRRRLYKQAAGLERSAMSAALAAGLYALISKIDEQMGG